MTQTSVQSKDNVVSTIRKNEDKLKEFGVTKLGLFGSFVREEQHPESDVDILVTFSPGMKTFDNFMALSFFLEDLLGRPVEVVTQDSLSPYLGPRIMQEVEYVTFIT